MEQKRCYGCMKRKSSGPVCEFCGYDERTHNAPHQIPAGTVLKEQYLVGKVLGQGGFGITYLGWDLYLDMPVAIKEYFPSGTVMRETSVTMDVVSCGGEDSSRFRNNKERFMREAKMLARFSQVPQIVQVKNFFLANNTAYIVMEYVEGVTLKQYVAEHGGKLSVEQTLSILGPVMQVLGMVHKAGLVHRDISPDNIMMLPEGGAKLLDFGAVRDVGAAEAGKGLTKSTEAILKQGYAPIEQYQKRGSLGPWTDVYAMCATMYYCLTGKVPPDAPERLLVDEELNWSAQVPELTSAQEAALRHGMELRTEERTGSMNELIKELFREETNDQTEGPGTPPGPKQVTVTGGKQVTVTGGKPVSVTGPKTESEPGRDPEPARPKRAVRMALIGALSVLLVVLVVFLAWPGGKEAPVAAPTATVDGGNRISGKCGQTLSWTLDPDTGELTVSGKGKMPDFNFYGQVYAPWWEHKDEIKSVRIESGVVSVGDFAFIQCTNLTALELPDTLEEIGWEAFDTFGEVGGLTELSLPDGLKIIGESAFSWQPIQTLTIPDSVTYVEAAAFDCNDKLKSVTIGPDTRLSLHIDRIFSAPDLTIRGYNNSMAEDYARIIGCNFESIGAKTWDAEGQCGDRAFWHLDLETGFLKIDGQGDMWDYNGTWMTGENENAWVEGRELPPWSKYRDKIYAVSLTDAVTSVGQTAFEYFSVLEDIDFGSGVTRIAFQSFLDTALERIVLPENVTNIEPHAFNWCKNLTEVRLPEGLKRLEENAISDCENLQWLHVGKDTVIDESHGLPFTTDDNGALTAYPNLTIVSLPGSDAERFAKEYDLKFQTGTQGMVADTEGQCGENVYWFKSGNSLMLYGTGSTWLFNLDEEAMTGWARNAWPKAMLKSEYPGYRDYAEQIWYVTILPGVTDLMHSSLDGFPNLRSIDFGTVEKMHCAVQNCPALEEVYLPETMTTVGEWSLAWNANLRRVYVNGGSREVKEGFLQGCYSLEEVWFDGKERIGDVDLFDGNRLGEGFVPDNVVFHVKHGSAAERYAKEHSIHYEYH